MNDLPSTDPPSPSPKTNTPLMNHHFSDEWPPLYWPPSPPTHPEAPLWWTTTSPIMTAPLLIPHSNPSNKQLPPFPWPSFSVCGVFLGGGGGIRGVVKRGSFTVAHSRNRASTRRWCHLPAPLQACPPPWPPQQRGEGEGRRLRPLPRSLTSAAPDHLVTTQCYCGLPSKGKSGC